ncbi:MAG: hypothetical protein L0211_07450, partial [Planctomycetaceae bacterium]|nr:hypothetical protein [Planctomycetaceae bacterium]
PVSSISPNSDSCNMSLARPMQISEGEGRRLVIPNTETVTCVTCKDFVKLFALLLALSVVAASAAAEGHGFAPQVGAATIVGPPPESTMQGAIGVSTCAACKTVATVSKPAPLRAVARGVIRKVARPAGKAFRAAKSVVRFVRHPFRPALRK